MNNGLGSSNARQRQPGMAAYVVKRILLPPIQKRTLLRNTAKNRAFAEEQTTKFCLADAHGIRQGGIDARL